jgi:hypothetical protein
MCTDWLNKAITLPIPGELKKIIFCVIIFFQILNPKPIFYDEYQALRQH